MLFARNTVFVVTVVILTMCSANGKRILRGKAKGHQKQEIVDEGFLSESLDEAPGLASVCDILEGKEARGLCNAYCEAKNCNELDDSYSRSSGKVMKGKSVNYNAGASKSCSTVKENFVRTTGLSAFPCEITDEDEDTSSEEDDVEIGNCPCWEENDLLTVTPDNQDTMGNSTVFWWDVEKSCTDSSIGVPETKHLIAANSSFVFAATNDVRRFREEYSSYVCVMKIDTNKTATTMNITNEQANACLTQIESRCAAIGTPIVDI